MNSLNRPSASNEIECSYIIMHIIYCDHVVQGAVIVKLRVTFVTLGPLPLFLLHLMKHFPHFLLCETAGNEWISTPLSNKKFYFAISEKHFLYMEWVEFFFLYQYFKRLNYHLLDSMTLDGEGLRYRNFLFN